MKKEKYYPPLAQYLTTCIIEESICNASARVLFQESVTGFEDEWTQDPERVIDINWNSI